MFSKNQFTHSKPEGMTQLGPDHPLLRKHIPPDRSSTSSIWKTDDNHLEPEKHFVVKKYRNSEYDSSSRPPRSSQRYAGRRSGGNEPQTPFITSVQPSTTLPYSSEPNWPTSTTGNASKMSASASDSQLCKPMWGQENAESSMWGTTDTTDQATAAATSGPSSGYPVRRSRSDMYTAERRSEYQFKTCQAFTASQNASFTEQAPMGNANEDSTFILQPPWETTPPVQEQAVSAENGMENLSAQFNTMAVPSSEPLSAGRDVLCENQKDMRTNATWGNENDVYRAPPWRDLLNEEPSYPLNQATDRGPTHAVEQQTLSISGAPENWQSPIEYGHSTELNQVSESSTKNLVFPSEESLEQPKAPFQSAELGGWGPPFDFQEQEHPLVTYQRRIRGEIDSDSPQQVIQMIFDPSKATTEEGRPVHHPVSIIDNLNASERVREEIDRVLNQQAQNNHTSNSPVKVHENQMAKRHQIKFKVKPPSGEIAELRIGLDDNVFKAVEEFNIKHALNLTDKVKAALVLKITKQQTEKKYAVKV
ncbi:hypothetical protein BCV72DRAFT_225361 [Rhizopus microsporus var. microsporus]|uniref:Uncharacterized protein n=2 Tax=Rhizopus microsporus TaxID=58291 RepID=A0A2G4SLQ9_RHIZD|nr:uncharacterized protein RHIMIDRAFT_262346 [Rhizopus microsporus ATCC 52813]ORE08230.1 hypothetical protein BCV72DRAFT_225361 [Rhizopus microsporus var. microsporus]PHZ09727.1 hypothetical protein RHIMIDRAFT_262346 [Rhizopus microsporus ATCC 52813]